MRKLLSILAALLLLASPAAAQNYNATAGSGLVFGSKLVTAVNYPQFVMCDPTTPANCVAVNASGQITVLGIINALPAGTNVIGHIIADSGSTTAVTQATAANLNATIVGTGTFVTQVNGFTSWAGGTLGAMANYGTSPGAVLVPGTNAFVTNTVTVSGTVTTTPPANASTNLTQVNSVALGSPAAYGTSPGAVNVPGVNAFVTNATPGIANNADGIAAVAASSTSPVPVNSYLYAFNNTTWDRVPIVAKSAAPTTAGNQALVVDLRPDSPGIIPLGPVAAASSVPMTIGPALLGSYCMGANTGTMAAGLGAGAPIYSFRYGGAALAIVRKVVAEADDITTAFVAGAAKFDMIAARSFTASDTGGTAATLTGNNGKLRTSFATTAISDLRISSTATLTAGTRTLDAQPLASVEFAVPTSIDGDLLPTTTLYQSNIGESPLVLATNEGFVIQATVPGTGTWVASVRVCWDEVSTF